MILFNTIWLTILLIDFIGYIKWYPSIERRPTFWEVTIPFFWLYTKYRNAN